MPVLARKGRPHSEIHTRLMDHEKGVQTTALSRRLSLSFRSSASRTPPLSPPHAAVEVLESRVTAIGGETNIAALFHQQAKLNPHTPAVEVDGERTATTYVQLDKQSSILAVELQHAYSRVVAICLDRSVQLVISILAVLKAGATYVVLDPSVPDDRNAFILRDVNAVTVLTSTVHACRFLDTNTVIVDEVLQKQQKHNPYSHSYSHSSGYISRQQPQQARHIDPASPAYIIYTSGSSGRPKGVVISHRAAAHGITHFSPGSCARWLLFYNPIFSAAQRTILATLCHGGTVCIADKEALGLASIDVIRRMRVDAVGLTPSILATLDADAPLPPCLKQIVCVGEPVSRAVADAFAERVEFRVSYGLSECAQLNMSRRLLGRGDSPAVVGQPADTTEAVVLRAESTELAQPGEAGELCLIGPQLADGYLNRPEESAKRFVVNPFGPGRMFRTGDLARLVPDAGGFEILGRLDNQTKIGGQRLEPEEVASVLAKHPAVSTAYALAATVKESQSLVAAIVLRPGYEWVATAPELRQLAQRMLPSYMVPSYWIQYHNALPLNTNGKVDKHAIKHRVEKTSPNELILSSDKGVRRSANNRGLNEHEVSEPVETIIQSVWADVLSLDPSSIDRTDSFLDLGGSSIQAIQMLGELRKVGIQLTLESMFRRETLAKVREQAVMRKESSDMLVTPFSLLAGDAKTLSLLKCQPGVVDAFPATDFQEGLLSISLQGSTDYTYQRVWDISDLDLTRLRLALYIAFVRSPNLRTTFISTDSGFVQTIRDNVEFPFDSLDTPLDQYLAQDLQRGFELGELFFRTAVVHNGQESVLVVTMHHALFDYWSHSFLYEDVSAYYSGLSPFPSARPGFHNFVAEMLATDWSPAEDFWKQELGTASVTTLNFAPTLTTINVYRTLPVDLREVASSLGVTVGTVVCTAWALVLAQHLGTDDVVFGTLLSGRETPLIDITRLDGPTLAVMPMRFVFAEGQQSLAEAVKMGHSITSDTMKHAQLGLRRILKAAGQPALLFDTMVNILPVRPTGQTSGYGTIFKPYNGYRPEWKSAYTTLEIEQAANDNLGNAAATARLCTTMEPQRAGFIIDAFVVAVQTLLHESQRPVSTLSMTTEPERAMLLQMSQPAADTMTIDLPTTMLTRYNEMVGRFPHRAALLWSEDLTAMSYADFDAKTNQLARYLMTVHGISSGDFVCLCLEKSPMMIVAIWAVLKAGAAYVPLGPEISIDRNRFIADEVGAKIVLSERCVQPQASQLPASVIILDDLMGDATFSALSMDRLDTRIGSQDVAYVIYTSGSTGKPKGVLVPHGAGAAAVQSMTNYEGRRRGYWRSLQFSNYIFDASVLEIFNCLSTGGTLCLAPRDRLLSDLAGAMNDMMVTHAFLTPTVARLLTPQEVPSLRALTVGGEALTEDIMRVWGDDCAVVQAYGPSETAIAVTMRDMEGDHRADNLGKPFPTVEAFVLRPGADELASYGAVGELCVAGPQLGLGYINRPEATASAFVSSTLQGHPKLLYRTGDLARWLPGGQIQYLGRKDGQVKVNGHRIELGEIERAVVASDGVTDCVAAVANLDDKAQIVVFVVFDGSQSAKDETEILAPGPFIGHIANLRHGLSGLTHYMLPRAVLPLASFPLMPSGKVDRKGLKARAEKMSNTELAMYSLESFGSAVTRSSTQAVALTSTATEKFLEKAFMAVLKIKEDAGPLGKRANFLALGGDSISAIALVSYARKNDYSLSVGDVLQCAVLEDMARKIGGGPANDKEGGSYAASDAKTLVEFEPPQSVLDEAADVGLHLDNEIEYVYPCPPGQAEFLSHGARSSKGWVLMTVREFPEGHSLEKWAVAVEALTQTNDILRTTFNRQQGGAWYGVVLRSSKVVVEMLDANSDEERQAHLDRIYSEPFVFGAPFIRYAAIRNLSTGAISLVTKMDHGVYDGTLLRIFDRHFAMIQKTGEPVPADQVSPFREYALHVHAVASGPEKARALAFFTDPQRQPALGKFQYPAGIPNPSAERAGFLADDTVNVESFARAAGVTPAVVFQAAFQCWLARATGRRAVGLDYLHTGRSVAELADGGQEANGCTANFAAVRATVSGKVGAYLAAAQAEFWLAVEHGVSVGLDDVFTAAGVDRERWGNRSLFVFQPFEAVAPPKKEGGSAAGEDLMQWVVMAKSKATMVQPYALVVEVAKTASGGHKVKVAYDPRAFSEDGAKKCCKALWDIVKGMIAAGLDGDIEECL